MKKPILVAKYYYWVLTMGFCGVIRFIGGASWIIFLAIVTAMLCKWDDRKKVK